MTAVRIGGLLERAVERWGAGTQVRAARVVEAANGVLREMFGDDIARYAVMVAYRRSELICVVTDPAASAAIRQRERDVLSGVQKKMPRTAIERLQIRIGG